MTPKLTIDPEFRDLLPKPTAAELEHLERSLVHEGCREPLMVWNGILLDGHNRYEICQRHDLVFKTREVVSADRQTASLWIIANQLGRRNLHPNHYAYYLGKRYEVEKKQHGGKREASRQNDDMGRTVESISDATGKSAKTVERSADFAKGVDLLEAAVPGSKASILNGQHTLTKGEIQKVAKLAKAEPDKIKTALAKTKDKPDEMEKLLREGEKKAYPWSDVDCIVDVLEGIEHLHSMDWARIEEYVTKSPTGICLLRDTNFKLAAVRFAALAKKLHRLK